MATAEIKAAVPPVGSVTPPMTLSQLEIQEAAEKNHNSTSGTTQLLSGLAVFFLLVGFIFLFLLPRKCNAAAYFFLALGLILLLIAAGAFAMGGPDRYCMRYPEDAMCSERYNGNGNGKY